MVAEAWRTFVAIPLPAGVATTLEARLAPHRAAHAQARWSDLADAHLTLVFLGATPAPLGPAGVASGRERPSPQPSRPTAVRA